MVVDKPPGPTSHDVVDRVRHGLGQRRVGHTGTLDPFATGVLPVCVGKATRLASFLSGGAKAYEASVRLGFPTDTDDATGVPLGPARPVAVGREQVVAECRRFVGTIDQVPPVYSAKRVSGKRLYDLARRGAVVERKAARVTVDLLEVRAFEADRLELFVRCSSGTYIRALARDLGDALGTGGHLVGLRRTESAGFGLAGAAGWEELADPASILAKIKPLRELLPEIPCVRVGALGREAIRHGRDVEASADGAEWGPSERFRILGEDGSLLALATRIAGENRLHPDVVLVD